MQIRHGQECIRELHALDRTDCFFASVLFAEQVKVIPPVEEPDEQTTFSAEDTRVTRPVPIPRAVLHLLGRDPDVRDALASEGSRLSEPPREWLVASEVHTCESERTLIVVARGILAGANVTTYWLFRQRSDRFERILKVYGHTLSLGKGRSMGCRDVITWTATAVDSSEALFRFDGRQYRRVRVTRSPSP